MSRGVGWFCITSPEQPGPGEQDLVLGIIYGFAIELGRS